MAYTTRADLEAAAGGKHNLVALADLNSDGVVDVRSLLSAQTRADAVIDSYAAMRYAVPIKRPSAAIVQMAADETIFQLKLRRAALTDTDAQERDARFQWLDRLAEGKVRPSDPLPPKSTAVVSRHGPSMREVSRAKTRGYW